MKMTVTCAQDLFKALTYQAHSKPCQTFVARPTFIILSHKTSHNCKRDFHGHKTSNGKLSTSNPVQLNYSRNVSHQLADIYHARQNMRQVCPKSESREESWPVIYKDIDATELSEKGNCHGDSIRRMYLLLERSAQPFRSRANPLDPECILVVRALWNSTSAMMPRHSF